MVFFGSWETLIDRHKPLSINAFNTISNLSVLDGFQESCLFFWEGKAVLAVPASPSSRNESSCPKILRANFLARARSFHHLASLWRQLGSP